MKTPKMLPQRSSAAFAWSVSLFLLGVTVALVGCKELTGSPGLPAGTPDPSFYNTAIGALGMRNAAIVEVEYALPQYILDSGLLTDELEDAQTGASPGALSLNAGHVADPLDERILPAGSAGGSASYGDLQNVRAFATQALGALATYDTTAAERDTAVALRGELYALEGYAEILLADLFCSGVPLSTLDYQKDFTYDPSSTTTQVYQDAIAKFDTALTLAQGSVSVVDLALVLKGRAYLDLGNDAAAADDVVTVPSGFQYQLAVDWIVNNSRADFLNQSATVSDREGRNGLPFLSSDDPRTAVDTVVPVNPSQNVYVPLTFPVKYSAGLSGTGYAPVTLASGVEARLIQAESALNGKSSGDWLGILNQLRANASLPDTLTDPGAVFSGTAEATARIALLFRERAYWLFLDGHRQGDLRRLLRQYGQYPTFSSQQLVYPTGAYLAPGANIYGTDVVAPIPPSESANPLFHGCLSNEA